MTDPKNKKTLLQRLTILFFIVVLSSAGVIFVFQFSGFLENVNRLIQGHIYVILSKRYFPLIFCFPGYLAVILILILRFIDKDTEKRINSCIKIVIISAIIFVIVRVPYGFVSSYYLKSKGYSQCWGLSSPSLMSPTVWVRNPGYCVNSASSLRNKILAWMDTLPNRGKNISPDVVQKKVETMHYLYHENRKKDAGKYRVSKK